MIRIVTLPTRACEACDVADEPEACDVVAPAGCRLVHEVPVSPDQHPASFVAPPFWLAYPTGTPP